MCQPLKKGEEKREKQHLLRVWEELCWVNKGEPGCWTLDCGMCLNVAQLASVLSPEYLVVVCVKQVSSLARCIDIVRWSMPTH